MSNEWNGHGLPPVGTVCEHADINHWEPWTKVTIVAHHFIEEDDLLVAVFVYKNGSSHSSEGDHFRPLRTPEQIAAEERNKAVHQMLRLMGEAARNLQGQNLMRSDLAAVYAQALHDAGYRKVEGGAA